MKPATQTPAQTAILRRNNVVMLGHDQGRPALVFVNGFGCDQSVWRSVAPNFAGEHRIVLFDHVGIGRTELSSTNAIRYASLHGYADDLREVCGAAGAHGAVLVGHSVGAIIGVLAAIRAPAMFRHLVLLAPSPCYLNEGSYLGGFEREDLDALLEAMDTNYRRWTHQVAPLIVGNPDRPELAWELESGFNHIEPGVARRFARLSYRSDYRADMALLTIPTTVLQCTDDNMVPVVVGEFMRESIRDCELIQLRASGHCPHMSAPQEVSNVLARLLEQDWAGTEPAELNAES